MSELIKLGARGSQELMQLMESRPEEKSAKKISGLKDELVASAKYNYDLPPLVIWNQVELKVRLEELYTQFPI